MRERAKWAFILDKDEFVRLSLSKILSKYGFEVEEMEDLSQLESNYEDQGYGWKFSKSPWVVYDFKSHTPKQPPD